jgi:hypothetical protein
MRKTEILAEYRILTNPAAIPFRPLTAERGVITLGAEDWNAFVTIPVRDQRD